MFLDLISYKIRVILNPGSYTINKKNPIDIEGTIIGLHIRPDDRPYYSNTQELIKLFVKYPSNAKQALVRWDNDSKAIYETCYLQIRSHQIPYWSSIWDTNDTIQLLEDPRPFSELKPQTVTTSPHFNFEYLHQKDREIVRKMKYENGEVPSIDKRGREVNVAPASLWDTPIKGRSNGTYASSTPPSSSNVYASSKSTFFIPKHGDGFDDDRNRGKRRPTRPKGAKPVIKKLQNLVKEYHVDSSKITKKVLATKRRYEDSKETVYDLGTVEWTTPKEAAEAPVKIKDLSIDEIPTKGIPVGTYTSETYMANSVAPIISYEANSTQFDFEKFEKLATIKNK